MPKLEVERRGGVWIVTINRPEVRGCIDPETARLLGDALGAFRDAGGARALVLTGAGGAFCSGADLGSAMDLFRDDEAGEVGPLRFARLEAGKPTIAAVEGHCLAGGLELACWADVRIAGSSASFGVVNRRWGIPLVDGGTQRLPRIVGLGNALYLIDTGAVIGADRAREMGLVQEVVAEGGALERALELAEHVAAYPQATLVADRASALAAQGLPLAEGLEREAREGLVAVGDGQEMAEGLRRFAEGDRPPPPRGG